MTPDPELPKSSDENVVVRVTTSGVHGRPSARPPGNRGVWVAVTALVAALVVGGLALRPAPTQTAQSTSSLDGVGGVGATEHPSVDPTALEPSTTEPEATPFASVSSTVLPTLEPTEAATPRPTKKPRPAATPYVEPTDSQYTEWTPPPGFVGSVTLSDNCHHANGMEEVLIQADFNSPVEVFNVMFYRGGTDHWLAMGGPPVGQEFVGTVIVGREFEVGTTIFVEGRFVHGEARINLIAKVQSDPFLVPQGPACP